MILKQPVSIEARMAELLKHARTSTLIRKLRFPYAGEHQIKNRSGESRPGRA